MKVTSLYDKSFVQLAVEEVIPNPLWLTQVRKNDSVFLVKEKKFARVSWEFEFNVPQKRRENNNTLGRICFSIEHRDIGIIHYTLEDWIVRANGTGLDYQPLILPVKGHYDPVQPSIEESDLDELRNKIIYLEKKLELIQKGMWLSDSLSGLTPRNSYPKL